MATSRFYSTFGHAGNSYTPPPNSPAAKCLQALPRLAPPVSQEVLKAWRNKVAKNNPITTFEMLIKSSGTDPKGNSVSFDKKITGAVSNCVVQHFEQQCTVITEHNWWDPKRMQRLLSSNGTPVFEISAFWSGDKKGRMSGLLPVTSL